MRSRSIQPVLRSFGVKFLAWLPVLLAIGCSSVQSTLKVVDFRDSANVRSYSATFDEAYYDIDPRGNLNLILRHQPSAKPGEPAVSQVLHVRTVWRSIPGNTVAHNSQINGVVAYAITSGGQTSLYEGAGAIFFFNDPFAGTLKGSLGRVVLTPADGQSSDDSVFERIELTGTFSAEPDARRTIQAMNELERAAVLLAAAMSGRR